MVKEEGTNSIDRKFDSSLDTDQENWWNGNDMKKHFLSYLVLFDI